MTAHAIAEGLVFVVVLSALAWPLGAYIARVFSGLTIPGLRAVERFVCVCAGTREEEEMSARRYAFSLLGFNALGFAFVYALQRLQHLLPLNPDHMAAVTPEVSFNTAVSFITNTNWQAYGGETTMSYLVQMLALTVQNFVSAATGIAVLIALIRGIVRRETKQVGNFFVDLTKSALYVLLPLSILLALVLVSQGVVQTFDGATHAVTLEGVEQTIAVGPAASQIAIKQLGTNGGGFFNANAAHPFENPTPFSNFIQLLAILLIPAALCFTFGAMVRDKRQGTALFAAMMVIFVPLMFVTVAFEAGNMEGKEVRFGVVSSAIWSVATTAASNGSVNAMRRGRDGA
jgi:potassium-transporting ATPase potassium-binding subunit